MFLDFALIMWNCLNCLAEWFVVLKVNLKKSAFSHIGGFFFFFFLKTNINDSRLNNLLRWIFLSCSVVASWIQSPSWGGEQIGSFMAQWTIDSVTSGVRQIEKMHGALNHCRPLLSAPSFLSITCAWAWNRCSMTLGITCRIKMRWGGWKIEHVVRPQWLFSVI